MSRFHGSSAGASRLAARLILLTAGLLAACAASRPPGAPAPDGTGNADSAARRSSAILYLARRKWHIDVGFAVDDLDPALAQIGQRFPGAKYLFFGFGDEHYLLPKNKHTSGMLGALLPGPGLVLVTAIENSPQQAFGAGHVLEIEVAAGRVQSAQSFVRGSLRGAAAPYAEGPYEGSLYFSATARYSAHHTCNTWAAEVLQSAGLDVRPRWVIFAGQLWSQARKLAVPSSPPGQSPPEGILAP